jgi:alkylation response protein AidB-like acyl-CoA dehydrogenase
MLMVDLRAPGVSTEVLTADAGTPERQYDVILDSVRVPAGNLVGEAANRAADHAIGVHGGNGLTDEYDLIPLWRTTRLLRFAPVNNEMVLNQISQHVLGLPRSY